MIPTLRPYQDTLVADIRAAMRDHRRVLAVAPTGAGKTTVFSYIAASAAAKGKRIVIVAHRAEIVSQICATLTNFGVRHGRVQPARTPTADPVQVAMVQTLGRRLDTFPAPDLIVVDEAHHAVTGAYARIAARFDAARILGVTATPMRLDGRGLGASFDVMVQGPTTRGLIEGGFLADFDYLAPPSAVDLSGIATRMGDYANDQLAAAMDKPTVTGDAVGHYRTYLAGRPAIAFCVNISHSEHVAAQFAASGIRSASIDGTMSAAERTARLCGLADGSLQVLTSADLIGEGVDVPAVAGAILLRPTKSTALYLQQIGRCLRLKPDGSRAVILDHVGNINHHGSPKASREWSLDARKRKPKEASIRQCNVCFMAFDQGEKYECGSDDPKCIFAEREAAPRELIETVAGELMQISETPAWAGGVNIVRAKGDEWRALLAHARTREQLQEIAKARGFRPGWIFHIEQQRAGRRV